MAGVRALRGWQARLGRTGPLLAVSVICLFSLLTGCASSNDAAKALNTLETDK